MTLQIDMAVIRATIISVLINVARIYVGFCVGYWLLHRYFVILPSRKMDKTPSDYGIIYEEVYFPTTAKAKLQGWFLRPQSKPVQIDGLDAVVVFLPGNMGVLSKFLPGLRELVQFGFTVFAVSYRGFGRSDFRWPTERGVYGDAESALTYLTKSKAYKSKQLILYGQSMGCAIASHTAAKFSCGALILEAGFPSVPKVMSRFLPWLPINLITTSRFDTAAHLKSVHCPVLVAHSKEDTDITTGESELVFAAAHEPKRRVTIHGAHAKGLEVDPQPYLTAIDKFLKDTNQFVQELKR